MAIGIDPTVDFAFKRLLGSPEHTRITVHFLNAVLGGVPRITDVTICNPFLEKEFSEDKLSILDVLAKDEFGRLFNVEMQTSLPTGLPQRLTFYAASLYVGQLMEGSDYPELRPTIVICVLNEPMFPGLPDLHFDFRLRDCRHGQTLTEDLQIHTIELPKYGRPINNEKISSALEKWLYFLRFASTSTATELKAWLPDQEFTEATRVLEMIANNPEDRMLYEARLKFQRDERARMIFAEQKGREEGLEEGLEIGREEGLKEGLEEGLEKGREEGEQIGRIRLLQQLLGISESSREQLAQFDLAALEAKAADLQSQLRSRET
jgi:predicted transposase/invertase (TIGR01784 family)